MMLNHLHTDLSCTRNDTVISDLSLLAGKSVGLLGGTFDPPHQGHLALADHVLESLNLDLILFMPANKNPLKANAPTASNQQRLDMQCLLLDDYPKFFVSSYELNRSQDSATIDTVCEIQAEAAGVKLYFIAGLDNLIDQPGQQTSLAHWARKSELLKRLEGFVVVTRGGDPQDVISQLSSDLYTEDENQMLAKHCLTMPPVDVQSREIREQIKKGELDAAALPDRVKRYIESRGLYS